jgi:hypothetical protein
MGAMQTDALPVAVARPSFVLATATVLTFVAVFAQALAGPLPALACSCITPMPTMAEVAREPGTVVLAGVVGRQLPDRTPVAVDTWFFGGEATDVVWLSFGSGGMTSCDPVVTAGERRLLVLYRQDTGMYSVNPCVESGVIGTPSGDEALATAQELFGGAPPPTPAPTDPPAVPPSQPTAIDPSWLYVGAIVGGALLFFGLIALIAIKRRPAD